VGRGNGRDDRSLGREREREGARGLRGVGEIYRIAGIIFQKESRRGQTLSCWRHRVVVKGGEG